MLQITPVLAALKRHKVGTLLIGLQIALTLAIVCNALFIIHQRVTHLARPSGVAEENLLTVRNEWTNARAADLGALIHTDMETLRQLPGVQDVAVSYGYPLRGGGWESNLSIKPEDPSQAIAGARFFGDEHVLPVLGARLITGRNFRADEVRMLDSNNLSSPSVVIITKALAKRLYPDGSALGKPVYVGSSATPSTIIGIIGDMAGFSAGTWTDTTYDYVLLEPTVLIDRANAYLIRTLPGQLDTLTKVAPNALFKINRLRIIPDAENGGVRTFAEVRAHAYKDDRGLALMMGAICLVLLMITAAGIVGLTSFWVAQRRKQIGVRRALGATRNDILSYFLTENLLICMGGLMVGTVLAVGLSQWLVMRFEMERVSPLYVLLGAVVLLLLGQAATLAPALRASRVPPVEATRSV
ncbi:ABC transporter permease [Dyella caseinilytica]|uniref:FtsX-like permease family protein n=1 Tax=Dyella caseinilytica TaxID=1849581 RepID=A0ABX7GSY1_9GAMM|nr:FtsX-like permease family protein [Dyella caseinilytica]QRN53546.1 FtsX-like permease family protein [Dyella caseinilytica]GFZ87210.1 ABC transporter permease [Dyella caseinilytica]